MAQKSILYIITKSVWGGAARYVYDLAVSLRAEQSNPEKNHGIVSSPLTPHNDSFFKVFVAAGGREELAQKIIKAKISYVDIKNFQRQISFFREFFAFFEILSLLFRLKPDIIHVNSSKAGGIVGIAGLIYKLLTGKKIKLIFTAHGWAFSENRPKWQIILIKFFSKLTAIFYDKIICVSEYDHRLALKNKIAPARKLITIHNGITLEAISFLPRKEAQKKLLGRTSPLVVGTIAEWTKNKGLKYLLEAMKKICHSRESGNPVPDLVLIGSGENPDKKKIYKLVEKHPFKKNIHLHEFIKNAASYLKAFDIFVLPSIKEGLPYAILEAIAAEVPIIATNVGGVPEILNPGAAPATGAAPETQHLVQPKNSRQLAEKISYFMNDIETVRGLTKEIKREISTKFSLKRMVQKTKRVYF